MAKQRKAIVDGLRSSIVNFHGSVEGSSTKDVMDLLLLTQVSGPILLLAFGSNLNLTNPQPCATWRQYFDMIRYVLYQPIHLLFCTQETYISNVAVSLFY